MKCLASQGYASTQEPMSEQAYVAAVLGNDPPAWSAYASVGDVAPDVFRKLEQKCPQPSIDR